MGSGRRWGSQQKWLQGPSVGGRAWAMAKEGAAGRAREMCVRFVPGEGEMRVRFVPGRREGKGYRGVRRAEEVVGDEQRLDRARRGRLRRAARPAPLSTNRTRTPPRPVQTDSFVSSLPQAPRRYLSHFCPQVIDLVAHSKREAGPRPWSHCHARPRPWSHHSPARDIPRRARRRRWARAARSASRSLPVPPTRPLL